MPPELLDPQSGLLAALLIAVGVLWREDRRQNKAMIEDLTVDRNFWRDLALTGTEIAKESVTMAAKKRP